MSTLEQYARMGGLTSAAAVVSRSGLLDWNGSFNEVFELASVTKLLSAYAVLVAFEERSVDLADAVGPPHSTLEHLLAHASGLSFADATAIVAEPGTRRVYSSAGFEVLASHVAARTGMDFSDYVEEAVVRPLQMRDTNLGDSPSTGARSTAADLVLFASELLHPTLVSHDTLRAATSVHFEGLPGVLPGFGHQAHCDWGLGFELKADKSPHWTGTTNSPSTFGHFGQSGCFVWVDPERELGLVFVCARPFGEWARRAWPALADTVVAEWRR